MIPKYPVWHDIPTYVTLIFLWMALVHLFKQGRSILSLIIISGLLIVATNLLSGVEEGLRYPIIGEGKHESTYWQESLNIHDPSSFLSGFTTIQPFLTVHGRIHPPGATLIIYYLRGLGENPYVVSALILIYFLVACYAFYQYLTNFFTPTYAKLGTLILLLIPAIQVYTWSTIDALVIAGFILSLWTWQHPETKTRLISTIVFVWFTSTITYATSLLLPVLAFDEYRRHKTIKDTMILVAALATIYLLINGIFKYNYLESFLFAKDVESQLGANPGYTPAHFVFSRIENILEILVFFGPILTYLLIQSIKLLFKQRQYFHFTSTSVLATSGLLAAFFSGAYYTGETARGGMYIYPFLIILVMYYLQKKESKPNQQALLLALIFIQTVLMQTFAWFSW